MDRLIDESIREPTDSRAKGNSGMTSRTPSYGRVIHAVGHAPFDFGVLFGLLFLISIFYFGAYSEWEKSSASSYWFSLFVASLPVLCLVVYCLKDRDGATLIVCEGGLWFWLPANEGTYYCWHEIESVLLKKWRIKRRKYYCIAITPYDADRYWSHLSLFRRIVGGRDKRRWGTPICVEMPYQSESDPDGVYAIIQSQWDKHRDAAHSNDPAVP